MSYRNPAEALANTRHEFGEHGGVNMSIEASTTFTVMNSHTMPEIFCGEKAPTRVAAICMAATSTRPCITSANN